MGIVSPIALLIRLVNIVEVAVGHLSGQGQAPVTLQHLQGGNGHLHLYTGNSYTNSTEIRVIFTSTKQALTPTPRRSESSPPQLSNLLHQLYGGQSPPPTQHSKLLHQLHGGQSHLHLNTANSYTNSREVRVISTSAQQFLTPAPGRSRPSPPQHSNFVLLQLQGGHTHFHLNSAMSSSR